MSYYRHGPNRPSGPGIGIGVPPVTPMIKRIAIISAAVWLAELLLMFAGVDVLRWLGLVPSLVVRGMIWQPVTWIFLHSPRDPMHLLFNMLMLWMFGGDLERAWGSRAFLRYYLVCGVGAGLCVAAAGLLTGSDTVTVGASGAIFGVLIAFGMLFRDRTVLFMFLFPMKARTMVLVFLGLNLFYLVTNPGSPVSHLAHLGGAVCGYLYLKRVWRFSEWYRELRWKIKRRKFRMMPPQDPDDRWLN